MDLGELEALVLKQVRQLGRATPGEIHRAVRRESRVAYTSVTTTLYRLVEKGLLRAERLSEKRVLYSVAEGSPAYAAYARSMADRLYRAFGRASISYLVESAEGLAPEELRELEERIRRMRKREG